jgi:hypothetical protein
MFFKILQSAVQSDYRGIFNEGTTQPSELSRGDDNLSSVEQPIYALTNVVAPRRVRSRSWHSRNSSARASK